MPLCLTDQIRSIAARATGRQDDLFASDIERLRDKLQGAVQGRQVLMTGAAGSIGSATLLSLLEFEPAALTVLDTSENNLAELIRSIRARAAPFTGEVRVQPLDYGSELAARYLETLPPHELVLSFAALKHVRSERDEFSALRLLDVNVVSTHRFLQSVSNLGHGREGVFFVSTDKAANPVSLMGASKRLMEWVLWAHRDGAEGFAPIGRATTTRFANVAFSDGSLPWAFLQRLAKQQPLAAPEDVRRFLVSPREAGDLCRLAAFACPDRHVLIPKLDPERDTVTFVDIAKHTLAAFELTPAWYRSEQDAIAAVKSEKDKGRYPVLLTRANTSGEKPVEEFVARDECAQECDLEAAHCISAPHVPAERLRVLLTEIEEAASGHSRVDKGDVIGWLNRLLPDLHHSETHESLDARL